MKMLSILVALFGASIAQAAGIPLGETSCTNYVCFNPAPDVAYIGTDSTYSSEVLMLEGTVYTGPTTSTSQTASDGGTITTLSAELRSADGRAIVVIATFRKWVVVVNSGR